MRHYIPNDLLAPTNPVGVILIGAGGTGSRVLTNLAAMSHALRELGHPGLHVVTWDPDTVSESNVGRQAFGLSDVGHNKAVLLTTRINRYYGTDWQAVPEAFTRSACERFERSESQVASLVRIVVTCVDSGAAREAFGRFLKGRSRQLKQAIYWLDYGNSRDSGQIILGTLKPVVQPKGRGHAKALPCITELFRNLSAGDSDEGPSCSMAEALTRQDLFINATMADLGTAMLWRLFRQAHIETHGTFLNLANLQAMPLAIDKAGWKRFGYNQ